MSLPDGGAWPPKELAPVHSRIATWAAWYSGDPDQLSAVYGGTMDRQHPFFNRPSQYRGGVIGALSRMFWGAPVSPGEQRTKLHVPAAGDVAATSADLLFSEPPKFRLDTKDKAAQERLDRLANDRMHATLLEGAEICAGLGGVFLRASWDKEIVPEGPFLTAVHPDAAVPEWRYGRLTAVTFWRELARADDDVIRHLERHEPGMIYHGLYYGTDDDLGQVVPLTEHESTAALAPEVDAQGGIPTGITRLTARYVPNMRPNRVWRNTECAAHLGRADISGTEQLHDALDETYTSLMRDLRLAKARLIVPDSYLQSNGPGRGATFDADREIYETLNMLPQQGGPAMISAQQAAIRVDEHLRTAFEIYARIITSAGYAGQTFGLTGEVAATATETVARERRSFVTRDRKITYWRPELVEMTDVLRELDHVHFDGPAPTATVSVEFADSVAEDPEAVARTLQLLHAAEAASTREKVRRLNPDWEDTEIDEEVERIQGDTGRAVEDPSTFRGGPINVEGQPGTGDEDQAESEQGENEDLVEE